MRSLCLAVLTACGRIGFGDRVAVGDAGDAGDTGVARDAVADTSVDAIVSPDANATHDEDGDGVPDVTDKCPNIADDQTDSDGDGVGDACDPNPTTPGDSIVLFEAFAGDALPAGWVTVGAMTWVVGGDDLTATFVDLEAGLVALPDVYAPPIAISTGYTLGTESTASTNYTVSTVDALDITALDSQKCGQSSPTGIVIGREMAGNTVEGNTQPYADAFATNGSYRSVMTHTTALITCDLTLGTNAPGTVTQPPYRTTGQLGLRARNIDVRFHYLMIVKS